VNGALVRRNLIKITLLLVVEIERGGTVVTLVGAVLTAVLLHEQFPTIRRPYDFELASIRKRLVENGFRRLTKLEHFEDAVRVLNKFSLPLDKLINFQRIADEKKIFAYDWLRLHIFTRCNVLSKN
jgi:hypothetical protein